LSAPFDPFDPIDPMTKHHEAESDEPKRGNGANEVDTSDGGPAQDSAPGEGGFEEGATLAAELAAARQQASENYEKYIRAVAEMQNVLRRQERERTDLGKYAVESLARDLLPTLDDFERALEHSSGSGGAGLVAGVEMVRRTSRGARKARSGSRLGAGQPFDPSRTRRSAWSRGDAAANTVVAGTVPDI
jgi:molecular chaperone GrpE